MTDRIERPSGSGPAAATTTRGSRRRRRRDRGQALVEFAMMIPFFFAIFAGIVGFGLALYYNIGVANAAREGARAAAMTTRTEDVDDNAVTRATSAAASGGMGSATVNVSCITLNATTTANPCTFTTHTAANAGGAQQGDAVRVTVSFTMPNPLPLRLRLGGSEVGLPTTFTLSSTVQMILDAAANG